MRCRLAISPAVLKRNQTLWASFLFVTPQEKIYYSGDSGYGPILRPLANSFWPSIDLAIMENGQYDQDWNIHMMPEETAQAADDLRARSGITGACRTLCAGKTQLGRSVPAAGGCSEGREWRLVNGRNWVGR